MNRVGAAFGLIALTLAACQAEQPADEPPNGAQSAPEPAEPTTTSNDASPADPAAEPVPPPVAAPPEPRAAWSPSGYRLIGTEPFWGGTVTADEAVYSTPENQAGERFPITVELSPTRETYRGTLAGSPFILTLSRGPCSDGMSDNVHAFTALLLVGGETRHGCANPR
jgi:uncharacterized membrane protein